MTRRPSQRGIRRGVSDAERTRLLPRVVELTLAGLNAEAVAVAVGISRRELGKWQETPEYELAVRQGKCVALSAALARDPRASLRDLYLSAVHTARDLMEHGSNRIRAQVAISVLERLTPQRVELEAGTPAERAQVRSTLSAEEATLRIKALSLRISRGELTMESESPRDVIDLPDEEDNREPDPESGEGGPAGPAS